jgi:hypothetical protein
MVDQLNATVRDINVSAVLKNTVIEKEVNTYDRRT